MKRIVITGANRGIGYALTKTYVAGGNYVFAVCRPTADTEALHALAASGQGKLTLYALDVRETAVMPTLSQHIQQETRGINLLINNAGILTDHETIENVREVDLIENYRVNTVAPVLLTQHLLPLLRQGTNASVVNISSSFASIGLKSANMPQRYSYSLSKAALNMFTKTLAGELAPEHIAVVAIHPGWTRTRLGGPDARFSAEEAAAAVVHTIEQLTVAQSGSYLTWDGREIGW